MSAAEHVRRWLWRAQTGCAFASLLAKPGRGLAMATFDALATPEQLDTLFDYAAIEHKPAIGVLTAVRNEAQLAAQLLALAAGERWRVRRAPLPRGLESDDVLVSIEWRTASTPDLWSSPMGLAPLGTMPATRRAPYVCIAAWTGGHENAFRKRVEPVVHFLDVDLSPYRLSSERYKRLRKESEKATAAILFDDSASNYRNVAFRLSAAASRTLSALPG